MPSKYLLNISFLIQAVHLFDKNATTETKLESLQLLDVLSDRVRESKYREKIETKLKGVKIKLKTFPKGKSLGSCQFYIKLDSIGLLYVTEYAIQKETHIEGVPHSLLSEKNFDIVISSLIERPLSRRSMKESLEGLFAESKLLQKRDATMILVFDQIPRIFELLLVIAQIVSEREKNDIKVFLPYVYDYYINVMKRLSEFMSADLAQNFCVDENDFFSFEFITYYSERNFRAHDGPKILVVAVPDLLQGKVFSILNEARNFSKIDIVFFDENAKRLYDHSVKSLGLKFIAEREAITEESQAVKSESSINPLIGSALFTGKETNRALQYNVDDSISKMDSADETSTVEGSKLARDIAKDGLSGTEHSPIFFQLKNNDFTFVVPKEEITKSDYGNLLTETEFTIMSLCDPGQNFDGEESNGHQKEDQNFTKTKEFFEDYINYNQTNNVNDLLINTKFYELNYSPLASIQDQIVFLSQIKAEKLLLLNSASPIYLSNLRSQIAAFHNKTEVLTVDKAHNMQFTSKRMVVEASNEQFEELRLLRINKDHYYSRIKFGLRHLHGKHYEMVLKNLEEHKEYQILKEKQLLGFKSYLHSHSINAEMEVRRLNVSNKVYVLKSKDTLVLEGVFCDEYFKVRKLLYDFINDI